MNAPWLALMVMRQTLHHPGRHVAFLIVMAVGIVVSGWLIGQAIILLVPGSGLLHFLVECAIWLVAVGGLASPLLSKALRERLRALVPA